ncbi:MAG: pterin-4-alpha-carbinolamine dehydratase [Ilumatobacter sp.]|nr:pterin-4-alpha-carbinolamine dehydratase [Ilumatobacter sp.]
MPSYTSLTAAEFQSADGVADWRVVLGTARAVFRSGSFPAAAQLVAAITEAAEELVHHPDIDVRYPGDVHVTVTTHATGGLTSLDVDLARRVSELAADSGASAAPDGVQVAELAIDTMDADRIRPFWAALLDYRETEHGTLVDPRRQGWSIWFQQMDEPRTERNRFHVDIAVPDDVAEQRIAAALAAGGTLVSDRRAKAFWVLADADGNEACICTWQDR